MGHRVKIRSKIFKCGHKGLGVECHRCVQANELETRANELTTLLKNSKKVEEAQLPKYVSLMAELPGVRVSAGGEGIVIRTSDDGKKKITVEKALDQAIQTMREKSAARLAV